MATVIKVLRGSDGSYFPVLTNGGDEAWPTYAAAKAKLAALDLQPGEDARVVRVDPHVANSAKILARRRVKHG